LIGGEQTINALVDTNELAPESIFTSFGRIGLARGGEPSGDLALNRGLVVAAYFFSGRGPPRLLLARMAQLQSALRLAYSIGRIGYAISPIGLFRQNCTP
jgi:hypothetical protein